jgi:catechol 2,3-dioxygenase-like lactoylglutathione lyase family enzyme
MIRKLHHAAWRCRDSEDTRAFYEDLLGLPLAAAFAFDGEMKGTKVRALHSFFALADGSFIAFFETLGVPFERRDYSDFDMHFAVEVGEEALDLMIARARERGVEVRGPVDHQIVRSIYLRDPNGYVVELSARTPVHDEMVAAARPGAHAALAAWQADKATIAA